MCGACCYFKRFAPFDLDLEIIKYMQKHREVVRKRARLFQNTLRDVAVLPAHEQLLFNTAEDRDAYEHMRLLEQKYQIDENFLAFQEEISPEMRYILVEWLSDVVTDCVFFTETLHLAVSIVDRTLKVLQCPRMCLQLVGIAAMVLASKLQETEPLSAAEVAHTSGFIFLPDQIVSMERIVFAKLDYQVVTPTSWWFAYRLLKIANSPAKVYYMVRYLLELALLEHTFVRFRPSVTGAAAFFLANVIFGLDYGLLNTETDIQISELRPPARMMLQLFHAIREKYPRRVHKKYGTAEYQRVSRLELPQHYAVLNEDH